MKLEIKQRSTSAVLFTSEDSPDLRSALVKAVKSEADLRGAALSGADLSGADLREADLSGADLSGADLSGAALSGAYLSGADLSGADLRGAALSGAYLRGADLRDIIVAWTSHDLIAELLSRWAKTDVQKRMLAGLVLVSRDWCWTKFLALKHPLKKKALAYLRTFKKDGDDCPIPPLPPNACWQKRFADFSKREQSKNAGRLLRKREKSLDTF
jgi:uncharacterized protein YjbI with pentapeptide repeats